MITKNKTILVFDLDDTLYKEIDFLKSAYREIAVFISQTTEVPFEILLTEMVDNYYDGLNVFKEIIEKHKISNVTVDELIKIYRNHKPQINLTENIKNLLFNLKKKVFKVGLITDGRSIQQRNKIRALGLTDYFDDIIISEEFGSEKPNINNFKYFETKYGKLLNYIYIGDNTKKDFIAPNTLGWLTLCLLDDGNNIHKQFFDLDKNMLPKQPITDLFEIEPNLSQLKNAL